MKNTNEKWTGEKILADFQKVNGIDVYALAKAINTAIRKKKNPKKTRKHNAQRS